MDEHTFDARPNRALIRTPMVVDEDGFQELADLHDEMYERTLDIQARSDERRTGESDDERRSPRSRRRCSSRPPSAAAPKQS